MNSQVARRPRFLRSDPVCIDMQNRLRREVDELQDRIERLHDSRSPGRYDMLRTYQRVLSQKLEFMNTWGFLR